jgi:hypothetical protein
MSEMNIGLLTEAVLKCWLADAVKHYGNGNWTVRKEDAIAGFHDKKSPRNLLILGAASRTLMQRLFVEHAVFLYDVVINLIPVSQDTP